MSRKEIKYVYVPSRRPMLEHWLSAYCDDESEFPENIVTSTYFDHVTMSHLSEKQNSDFLKYKFRLRWYGDPVSGSISKPYAEIKMKEGGNRIKKRLSLDLDTDKLVNEELRGPTLTSIPWHVRQCGMDVDPKLAPILQLSYRRRRYIHRALGISINIDWDIRPVRANPQLLRVIDGRFLPAIVCELKGEAIRLPRQLLDLTTIGGRRCAYSKYYECYLAASRQHAH
jgi:VTC domain